MTRSMLATLAAAAVGLSAPLATHAQTHAHPVGDSLVRVALGHARSGDTVTALKVLERANKVVPRYAPAFYQRGVLLSRASRLGLGDLLQRREAVKALNRALDLDADNPFYLLELGRVRLKTPFLRLDAERLFNKALKAARRRGDPGVLAEVRWELGQIYERRYQSMANRHMLVGQAVQFDPEEAVGDWHYTPDFLAQRTQSIPDAGELDFRKAEEHYRAALEADPGHAGAALGLITLLYEAQRVEEMARIAREAVAASPDNARLRFALGLALHRMDRDVEAQAVFDTALALLPPGERHDMVGLQSVLRKEAAAAYDTLPAAARAAMDSMYWSVADPLRLTPVNEAEVEFLARVAFADLRFSAAEFGTRGWRTDRGQVVLRYGEPPVVATFAPQTAEVDGSDAMGRVTTVWYYPKSKLRFVFVGPPAMNYAFFAGNFRSYAENARHLQPISFDNIAERVRVDSVPVQVARFRAPSGTGAEVAIYADLPTGRMLRGVDVSRALVETGLFLSDASRRAVTTLRDTAQVRLDTRDRITSRTWVRALPDGEYLYRVEAREPVSGRSARGLAAFDVASFPAGQLTMSDVLVARRIVPKTEAPTSRGDFFIGPNAAMTFGRGDTLALYWENYGVTPDSTGNGRLRITLTLRVQELQHGETFEAQLVGGLLDAVGLTPEGDDRVALRYERTVALDSADRVPNYLAIHLGDAPYGTYALELTVTDLTSGRSTTRQRTITVPRP